ncbi:MAG: hypothetical protein ABEI80_07615 [Haloplanus sp.]
MNKTGGEVCPLCSTAMGSRGSLRTHLMVDHRKSEVVDEYIDRAARPATMP